MTARRDARRTGAGAASPGFCAGRCRSSKGAGELNRNKGIHKDEPRVIAADVNGGTVDTGTGTEALRSAETLRAQTEAYRDSVPLLAGTMGTHAVSPWVQIESMSARAPVQISTATLNACSGPSLG